MNTQRNSLVPSPGAAGFGLAICGALTALSLTGCGPNSGAAVPPVATPVAAPYQPMQPPVANGAPPVQAAPQQSAQPYPSPAPQVGQAVPPAPVGYQNANPGAAQAPVYAQAPSYPTDPTYAQAPTYAPAPTYVQAPPQAVPVAPAPRVVAQQPVASNHIGRISSIEAIRERPQGSGAGGVLGGVLGAVVGNQFGHGNGRTALTVLGAAGGAVAGNNVERNIHERVVGYRIHVRLDDGQVRSYQEGEVGDLQVGDRVRIDGQRLRRI